MFVNLECFQEKWTPVFRPKTRQIKGSEGDHLEVGVSLRGCAPPFSSTEFRKLSMSRPTAQ